MEWAGQTGLDSDQPAAHILYLPFFHSFLLSTSSRADLRAHLGTGLPASLNLNLNLNLSLGFNLARSETLNPTRGEVLPEARIETCSLTCLPASRAALPKGLQADEQVDLDLDIPAPLRPPPGWSLSRVCPLLRVRHV